MGWLFFLPFCGHLQQSGRCAGGGNWPCPKGGGPEAWFWLPQGCQGVLAIEKPLGARNAGFQSFVACADARNLSSSCTGGTSNSKLCVSDFRADSVTQRVWRHHSPRSGLLVCLFWAQRGCFIGCQQPPVPLPAPG